ncbi:MAG TPA: hypothetical protein VFY91_16990 [Microbacterium sp.]|nr:hypothetical protein [Microbacterium sp.]
MLAFSAPDTVSISIVTKNASAVDAIGMAVITGPDGARYPFGPRTYAAGEVWTYDKVLTGYTCGDLEGTTGVAIGFALGDDGEPDWTSGTVRSPDPRVTVTGCDPSPPPPVDPETPVTPGSPGTPVTPGVTAQPGAVAAPVAAPVTNTLPASQTDGALVGTPWPTLGIAGVVGLMAAVLSAGMLQWARRH